MTKQIRLVDVLVAVLAIAGLYMFFYGFPSWVKCGSLTPKCVVYIPAKTSENRPPGFPGRPFDFRIT